LRKTVLFALITMFFSHHLFAQINDETEKEIDSIIEELIFTDSENLLEYIEQLNKYQVLYASVGFNDKTYFLGRDLGLDQTSLTAQFFYEHSIGVFIGVSGALYNDFDPKWDYTTLTGGYGNHFGKHKNFSYQLSYNRYIFSDATSNDFENSFDIGFSAETKNSAFGVSADLAYFFAKEQGFQNSFDVYGEIKLFKLNDDNNITFNPLLTFQFGSENIDTSRIDDLAIDTPFLDRVIGSFEKYDLRNIQLQLPITIDLKNFEVLAGYNFNFPNALEFERNLDNSSYFNLRLSYIVDLK